MVPLSQTRKRSILFTVGLLLVATLVSAKSTTVTLQVDNRATFTAWVEKVIASFEQEHPDIKVDLWVPTGGLLQQVLVRIAGGMPLDVGLHDPYAIIDFARQGLLADLTPYVQRDAAQFAGWLPPAMEMTRFRGALYSLPRDLQCYGVYYNADAYAASGLTVPGEQWTYADLQADAKRLTIRDAEGRTLRHGFMLPRWRSWVIPVWAYGGDFVDSWTDPTRFTGHAEGTIKALDFLRGFAEAGAMTPPASELTAFMQQRIAIGMSNTIDMDSYRDIKDFAWDVAALPTGPAGRVAVMNALGWFMMSSSPCKDEAWALMRHLTSPTALRKLAEEVAVIPPDRKLAMQVWVPSRDKPVYRRYFLTGGESAYSSIGALPQAVYAPIEREGHDIVFGRKAPSAALEHMEQGVNAAILALSN